MHTDATSPGYTLAPFQFSRLTRRGVLLGLRSPQLVALSIRVLTIVSALYTPGASGIAWTSPIRGTAALVAAILIGGRTIVEWVPITGRWLWRASAGSSPRPTASSSSARVQRASDTPPPSASPSQARRQ